jgi:beta-glucosidase/6-phospho-beta-glucosidase/beta-galactosidase
MPTLKQKRAIDKLVGNGGNITKAMKEAGYSPNTANTPQKLTESIGFKELCEQYLPDSLLLGALKEDIIIKKQNRKSELELGFKIKGHLKESVEHSGTVNVIGIEYYEPETKDKTNTETASSISSPEE